MLISDTAMNRRTSLIAIGGAFVSASSLAQTIAEASFYLPYQPTWKLPGPIATCGELRRIVAEAQTVRERVKAGDRPTILAYKSSAQQQLANLNNELNQLK